MLTDKANYNTLWTVTKFKNQKAFENGEHFEQNEIKRNVLLNEGIAALLNLLTGAAETAFNNASSYLGVGSDNTASAATQTGLIAGTPTYVGMESGYPQVSGQTVTWRAVFDADTGNHAWQEFTVANGTSNAADNLNRRVDDQGTKASGQVWTLDLAITWS